MQINANIKFIRELSGKKQAEFAGLIKTNVSNLKTYENTDVRPKANVLAAIANLAGVTIKDLESKHLNDKDIKFNWHKVEKDEINEPAVPYETKIPADEAGLMRELLESQRARIRLLEERQQSETRLIQVEATLKIVVEILDSLKIPERTHTPTGDEPEVVEFPVQRTIVDKNESSGRKVGRK